MPRCAVRHVKLVAEAELPILPFLAPRVFHPWPIPLSRSPAPKTSQAKAFSTSPCEHARRSRSSDTKYENARSLLAQEWYQSAIAPLDPHEHAEQSDKVKEKGNESDTVSKPRPSLRRSDVRKAHSQRLSTSRALVKARWTASKRDTSVRTKWAPLGRPVRRKATSSDDSKDEVAFLADGNFLYWNHHFAKLNARHDARLGSEFPSKLTPNLNFRARKWAALLLNAKQLKDMDELAALLGHDSRRKWMHALLWTLDNSIDDAVRLLNITHISPYLPAAYITDALNFIAQHYSANPTSDEARQQLVDVLCTVMERPGTSPLQLMGSTLRKLLHICTEDQVLRLFDSAVENGTHLQWNTRLHLATYLARHNHFDRALDTLLDAVSDGAHVNSQQFESTCATILRKAGDQPDGLRVSLRLVQNLSEIGVQLNVQLCNIVMLNAVEADDLKTAFSIYHSLVDNNLEADQYTHAILLKGCKTAIDDSETLNTTIRQAIADVQVLNLHVVATEIVHCLSLHHSQIDPENAFPTVAEAFAQLFDASELIRLGILPQKYDNRSMSRMQPTLQALGVMINAYLRHVVQLQSRNTTHIHDIYRNWRSLVEHGIRPYVNLAKHDYIANAFLLAFIQDPSGLAHAAEVIRDMQTPLPSPQDTSSRRPTQHTQCKPTIRSWSIFLHGFAKHGKMDLAEQVLVYMRKRRMQPNEVTWNSLLGGYTRSGEWNKAVATFVRMRDEGFEATEVTQRHMAKIKLENINPRAWESGVAQRRTTVQQGELGERVGDGGEQKMVGEEEEQEQVPASQNAKSAEQEKTRRGRQNHDPVVHGTDDVVRNALLDI